MRALVLSTLLLLVAAAVAAQDPPQGTSDLIAEMSTEDLGRRATELLTSSREDVLAIQYYTERLKGASHEDSLVLNLQRFERRMGAMAAVHELVGALLELEKSGPREELRERVTATFALTTPFIWAVVREFTAEIDEQRARRPQTAPADRSALEDHIARSTQRLDRVFRLGDVHLRRMATLGEDTTAARTTYIELLRERADDLSGRLELDVVRASELSRRLKETPDNADVAMLSAAVKKSIERDTDSFKTAISLLRGAGLEQERYRAQLLTLTQDFTSGFLDTKVAVSLLQKAWRNTASWLAKDGPGLLVKLLVFLAILFVGRILARVVRRTVIQAIDRGRTNMSRLLRDLVVSSSYNAIMALALMMGLAQLGISLGPLLAGFGVVGFILGFAMQDSLSNLAAGMMILINRPYDVGDLVEVAGAFGKVERMSLVSTGILTLDNQKLLVPNSKIWGDVIKNITDQHLRRVDMIFGISYGDDIPKAEKILEDILAKNERVLDDPAPIVRLHNLGDSSVDFVVRPWVKTDDYWDVFWEVTRAVKMRFDEEGVSIPFPQRDVHIYEERLAQRRAEGGAAEIGKRLPDSGWQQESAPEADDD